MKRFMIFLIFLITIFATIFNGITIGGVSIWTYLAALQSVLIIAYLLNYKINMTRNYKNYMLSVICFITLVILVCIFNDMFFKSLNDIVRYIMLLFLSISVYATFTEDETIMKWMKFVVFLVCISAIFSIGQYLNVASIMNLSDTLNPTKKYVLDGTRASGLSESVINLSYDLIFGALFCMYMLLKRNTKKNVFNSILNLVFFGSICTALFINETRSALVAVGLCAIVLFANYSINKSFNQKFKLWALSFVSLILILIIYNSLNLNISERFQYVDSSSQSRIPMLVTGVNYALNHPLGTGDYQLDSSYLVMSSSAAVENTILNNTTHNHFINMLVYYGFLGFFLSLVILYVIIKSYTNHTRQLKQLQGAIYVEKPSIATVLFIAFMAYNLNSLTHNNGMLSLDPNIWIIVALLFANLRNHEDKLRLMQASQISPKHIN